MGEMKEVRICNAMVRTPSSYDSVRPITRLSKETLKHVSMDARES
jgi:hypothetical protein